jgi:hypothetical protein
VLVLGQLWRGHVHTQLYYQKERELWWQKGATESFREGLFCLGNLQGFVEQVASELGLRSVDRVSAGERGPMCTPAEAGLAEGCALEIRAIHPSSPKPQPKGHGQGEAFPKAFICSTHVYLRVSLYPISSRIYQERSVSLSTTLWKSVLPCLFPSNHFASPSPGAQIVSRCLNTSLYYLDPCHSYLCLGPVHAPTSVLFTWLCQIPDFLFYVLFFLGRAQPEQQ